MKQGISALDAGLLALRLTTSINDESPMLVQKNTAITLKVTYITRIISNYERMLYYHLIRMP